MTRRRSSPLGLELVLSVVLALVVLPLLSHGAPVQESQGDLQRYSEGCYYNYNHYSEGDRILTNEPCLNCTCHNKMLMCYLRVCPFTKPIGHDCTVEKREDQCCPIVTCPEVPVDVAHHSHQLTTSGPGTELSIPEKYGCSIDNKFYVEGAQVPSNPNKPCELCYCIRNRTSCLMQECTLHIDGCQPIYNKGSCCPVRYNCDHENELLEIEDFSTTTTTIRPTQGYLLQSTTSPSVTTDCFHNNEVYADGASITGKNSCEHCYCMRGDIVCAVQECEMPTLESGAKTCHALPPAAGECCPSNYICDDDIATTEGSLIEELPTTIIPMIQNNLHESVSQEDVQLQEHIDDKIVNTEVPEKSVEHSVEEVVPATHSPIAGEVAQPSEEEIKDSEEEKEEKPLLTTVSAIKETSYEATQSPIEHSTTHKTEVDSHQDNEDQSTQTPIEDEIINEDEKIDHVDQLITTVSPVVGDIQKIEEDEVTTSTISSPTENTTAHSMVEDGDEEATDKVPLKEDVMPEEVEITTTLSETEKDLLSTSSSIKPDLESEYTSSTTLASIEASEDADKLSVTESVSSDDKASETSTTVPSKTHIEPVVQEETSSESVEFSEETASGQVEIQDKNDKNISEPSSETATSSPIYEMITEGDDSHIGMPEIGDHKTESDLPKKKPKDEPESLETLPTSSDKTKYQIPQIIADNTTVSAATQEEEIDVTTKLSSSEESDEIASSTSTQEAEIGEVSTSKPLVIKEEPTTAYDTQATIEDVQKPVSEEDEVPAVVQEVSHVPSKPISGDISEEDMYVQTTALPTKDEEANESHDKADEDQSTEHLDIDKRTTTSRPVRIHIADEEESTEIPSKGQENVYVDSSTSVPSFADDTGATEEVSIEHGKPHSEEKEEIEKQDIVTKKPSAADSGTVSTEEESITSIEGVETSAGELTTPSSYTISDEKQATESIDQSTSSVADSEQGISASEASEEEKLKPESGDSTLPPSIYGTIKPNKEEEMDLTQPEHNVEDRTTSAPLTTDSEDVSHEDKEEEQKQPEDIITASTAKYPSGDQETSTEEDQVKGKPQYDSTERPTISVSDATITEEEVNIAIDATAIPADAESKPEAPGSEETTHVLIDSTTVVSPTDNSGVTSSEEDDIKERPDHELSEGIPPVSDTESPISVEEGVRGQPEISATDSTVDESIESQKEDVEKQSEQDISDSTTISSTSKSEVETKKPTISEHDASSAEKDETIQPDFEITRATIVIPSAAGSDEESKEGLSDSTTASTPAESEEEIGKETKTPISATSETSTIGDEKTKEQQFTTIIPSLADAELSTTEKETVKEQQEPIDGNSTASSIVDSSASSETTGAPLSEEDQKIIISTPAVSHPIELEQTSTEAYQEKQSIDKDDVLETTLSPILYPHKESSESADVSEGSGIEEHDIIPSAIPGEGDCLVSGKTFSNNATVPTSSECELSCSCINSIVVCQRVKCDIPPQPNNCVLDDASTDRCCPQYICGIDSFTDDQRPTTPEEIEDEEIQFTTLAPTSSTSKPVEDVTIIYSETPKKEEQSTEIDQLSDKNTTPSSVDIELPAVIRDESMSHTKDTVQEQSTEHSGDVILESSTSTTQPITTKPTKQVTGDIELPIELTAVPEETTTLGAITVDDAEDHKPTSAPTMQDVSSETITPVILKEEISTKTPTSMEVLKNDESTEDSLEKETTTLPPLKTETGSKIPIVIDRDESAQSEETTETSDEASNESGEEIESEEDTKSPILQREEVHKSTTSKPLVSEHVGDIKPVDESTTIPEIHYQKPEMPQDLSHTKEEEPTKPIVAEESKGSDESEESEEITEKTPTFSNTVISDTPVGISDKKDDIPSSDDKPIVSTVTPIKPEEEPDTETTTDSKKDAVADQTISPLPVPADETGLDKESIPNQTSKPIEEKPIAGTILPTDDDEDLQEITPSTTSPAIEEHSIEGSGADISEESDDTKIDVVSSTSNPASSDESIKETVDVSSQTNAPTADDHTVKDGYDIKLDDTTSQTTHPSIEEHPTEGSGSQSSEEKTESDEVVSQTSVPVTDKETTASVLDEEEKIDVTTLPTEEELSIEGSGAPIADGKPDIEEKDISSPTTTPAIVKQPSASDLEKDITTLPSLEEHLVEGSGSHISEDEDDNAKDKTEIQTNAPTSEDEPISTIVPSSEHDSHTISPSISGTVAPASETESDDSSNQTSSPSDDVEPKPIIHYSEKEQSIEDTFTQVPIAHITELPTKEQPSDSTTSSGTFAPVAGDKYEETELPDDKKPFITLPTSEESELTTVSPEINDEKLDVTTTPAPTKKVETSDEEIDVTLNPSKESDGEHLSATESSPTSISAESVESGEDESSTIIPIKAVKLEESDATELPSNSTSPKPVDNIVEDHETTKSPDVSKEEVVGSSETTYGSTLSDTLPADSKPTTPVTILDQEIFIQTQAPINPDDHDNSEEELSTELPNTNEQDSKQKQPIDKTLITTEIPLQVGETTVSSSGSQSEEIDSEEKLSQVPTITSSPQTEKPETIKEETLTEEEEVDSEGTYVTVKPEIISSHEAIPQRGKPESDDQILGGDMVTPAPLPEVVSTQTGSSVDEKKPSVDESNITTQTPVDKLETDKQPEESISVDSESAESKPLKPVAQTESPELSSSEEEISKEKAKPEIMKPLDQTEAPASISPDDEVSSQPTRPDDTVTLQTKQPIPSDESTPALVSIDDEVSTFTTQKPQDDSLSTESEEEADVQISSTVTPVEKKPIIPSESDDHTDSDYGTSTEGSGEEKEQFATPKDETKLQTSPEFVTESIEDLTTKLPVKEKEDIPVKPVSQSSEETTFSSAEEVDKEKPQIYEESYEKTQAPEITTEVMEEDHKQTSSIEDSEEKTQTPEISTESIVEVHNPSVQPTSSLEESEEKTESPEISTETVDEDHKPHVRPTSSIEESEEKNQSPETSTEAVHEDHKPHIQPTSSVEESEETTLSPEISTETIDDDHKPHVEPTSSIEDSDEKTESPEIPKEAVDEDHKQHVEPTSSIEDSEEKTQSPEISTETIDDDHKPHVQPTSSIEKSEEKTESPEISTETIDDDHKPHVQPTSSIEESEEKTQSPEISTETIAADHKLHVQPTSSIEESEEKTQSLEISTETIDDDHKPHVQPTSSIEKSEEKTESPEISTETIDDDHKPHVQPTSSIEESEEKTQSPEISTETIAADHKLHVQPTSSIEESEEKTQSPEISTETINVDHKPHVQPTSSIEESEEKTQSPEISTEAIDTVKKPHVEPTSSTEESDEKTQAPEILLEASEEDQKPSSEEKIDTDTSKPMVTDEKPSTEEELAQSTTVHPLFPHIEHDRTTSRPQLNASVAPSTEDEIEADIPKPMVTEDQPIAEEETPLLTTIHPLFPHIEHDRTTSPPQHNASDKIDDNIPETVANPVNASSSSSSIPTTEQSTTSQAPTSHYQPPGYGQVPPHYPSYAEDEYTDEDETEVFGPGTCRYGGKLFVSAQQIPRDDPCDFCFCFRSDIICLQQSCPPPISGCHEEPISGFCCPRYECPVSMATTLNITTSTTTTSTTLPPHFLHHAYRGAAAKNGCHISGKSYKVGDKIDSASGPCMHCTCGGDGQMKCDPKTCSPEPMLRQMIAVVASRRR